MQFIVNTQINQIDDDNKLAIFYYKLLLSFAFTFCLHAFEIHEHSCGLFYTTLIKPSAIKFYYGGNLPWQLSKFIGVEKLNKGFFLVMPEISYGNLS